MGDRIQLSDDDRQFLIDNHKRLSERQIARRLGISRSMVDRYVKEALSGPAPKPSRTAETVSASEPKSIKLSPKLVKALPLVIFFAILLLAFDLRKNTFNLPHFRGDEHHYIGLAFKLDTQGISGYSLRAINMLGNSQYPNLVQFGLAQDKGEILKSLAAGGITYYDEPLHHIPFGFPAALMISHKIFAPGQPYYALAIPNDTELIRKAPPGVGLRYFRFPKDVSGKQFYAIIVPLFFSLLLIVITYFLAKILFNDQWVALTAMFLMAISPVDLLTSQKVWADDMTAALAALGAFLYCLAVKKNYLLLALAGGISCGLSIITKQNGAIIPVVIVAWHFISNLDRLFKKESFLSVVFDKRLMLFAAGIALSTAYWFFKIFSAYGDLLYRPSQENLAEVAKTDWFKFVQSRPKHLYLLGIPYQNPIFGLAYIAPLWPLFGKNDNKNFLLPVAWLILSFCLAYKFMGGEERYMLPAYPALAILGAFVANEIRVFLDGISKSSLGTIVLLAALMISFMWSPPIGLDVVFHGGALIVKPF